MDLTPVEIQLISGTVILMLIVSFVSFYYDLKNRK